MTFVALTLLVVCVSVLGASWLTDGSAVDLVLGAYVLAVGQVVVVSFVLSVVGLLTPGGYAVGFLAIAAPVVLSAWRRPPRFPARRHVTAGLGEILRDPILAVLAVVVAVEGIYVAALAALTPPNDWDALAYHLTRAAFWVQERGIGYVDGTEDQRMNAFPPNAEIIQAFTLSTSGGERFVALPNVAAALVAVLAVFRIGRRIGFAHRESAFGALLFATLPLVVLQGPSALNDLPVAALVAASAAFLLHRTPADLALGASAAGLAVGTKVSALLALPVLAVLVWLTWRPRVIRAATVAIALLAAGSVWYLVNVAQTGHPLGSSLDAHGPGTDVVLAAGRAMRLLLLATDLPGAVGNDRLVYPLAAALIVAAAVMLVRRRVRVREVLFCAALVAAVPLLVPVADLLTRSYRWLWFTVGREDIGLLDHGRSLTVSEVTTTAFGPLGLTLVIGVAVLTTIAVRSRDLPGRALVLAIQPVAMLILLGLTIEYFPFNARHALAGFALGASCWGIVLRYRAVAAATVAITAVTLLLATTHSVQRPSGLELLAPAPPSAFGRTRSEAMAVSDGLLPVLEGLNRVPDGAVVANWPPRYPDTRPLPDTAEMFPYLLFGQRLAREVRFADTPAAARSVGAT